MDYEDGINHHVETCPSCSYLEEHGHPEECAECGHPWHVKTVWIGIRRGAGGCWQDRGDVVDERYKGGMVAIGPCPCEGSETMTRQQAEDEQNRHARDEDEAAYDKAMDQKLSEWKNGDYDDR